MPRTTTSDPAPPGGRNDARVVLVIDDLQWADDDSLELLALLVERIARPLTIIASWTTGADLPDVPAALLDRLASVTDRIDLAPLAIGTFSPSPNVLNWSTHSKWVAVVLPGSVTQRNCGPGRILSVQPSGHCRPVASGCCALSESDRFGR